MATIGTITGILDLDGVRFNQGIQEAESRIKRFGRTATQVGAGISAAITLPLAALGKRAVSLASEMEQAEISFSTLLGSASKATKFITNLENFAASTPFEFRGLVKTAQNLLAVGVNAKNVIPTLTTMGDTLAALGQGDEVMQRIILNLGQIKSQGKVTTRELNDFARNSIPALAALSEGLGKTQEEVQDLISKGQISAEEGIPALLKGLERRFGGLMTLQAKTFTGMVSNLIDIADQSLARLGKTIIEALNLKGLVSTVIDAVGAIRGWFDSLEKSTQRFVVIFAAAFGASGPLLVALGGFILLIWPIITPLLVGGAIIAGLSAGIAFLVSDWERFAAIGAAIWGDLAKFIEAITRVWLPPLLSMWEQVEGGFSRGLNHLKSLMGDLTLSMKPLLVALGLAVVMLAPWTSLVVAIAGVGLAGAVLLRNWSTIGPALVDLFSAIWTAFLRVVVLFQNKLPLVLEQIKNSFNLELGAGLFAGLAAAWLLGLGSLVKMLARKGVAIASVLGAWRFLFVGGAIVGVIAWLASQWEEQHTQHLKRVMNNITTTVKDALIDLKDFIMNFDMAEAFHRLFNIDFSSTGLSGMTSFFDDIKEAMPSVDEASANVSVVVPPVDPAALRSYDELAEIMASIGQTQASTKEQIAGLNDEIGKTSTISQEYLANLQRSGEVLDSLDSVQGKMEQIANLLPEAEVLRKSRNSFNAYRDILNKLNNLVRESSDELEAIHDKANLGIMESTQRTVNAIQNKMNQLANEVNRPIQGIKQNMEFIDPGDIGKARALLITLKEETSKTFRAMGQEVASWNATMKRNGIIPDESTAKSIENLHRIVRATEDAEASAVSSTRAIASAMDTELVGTFGAASGTLQQDIENIGTKWEALKSTIAETPEARALMVLIQDLKTSISTIDQMKAKMQEVPASISQAMTQSTSTLTTSMSVWEQLFGNFVFGTAETMRALGSSIVQGFGAIRSNFANMVVGMVENTTTMKDAIGSIWRSLLGIFIQTVTEMIGKWILAESIMTAAKETGESARTAAAATGDAARVSATVAAETAQTSAASVGATARAGIMLASNKLFLGAAASQISAFAAVGTAAIATMKIVVAATSSMLAAIGAALIATVVGSPFGALYEAAAGIALAAGTAAALAAGAAIAGATSVGLSAIGGLAATPFAEGGLVTQPTLGLVGEAGPEVIAPFSEFKSMMEGSGETNVTVMLDGRVIARNVMRHMPKVIRAQGIAM